MTGKPETDDGSLQELEVLMAEAKAEAEAVAAMLEARQTGPAHDEPISTTAAWLKKLLAQADEA